MKFLEPWAGITTCIRKDQKELRKKKARTLLWAASFPPCFGTGRKSVK